MRFAAAPLLAGVAGANVMSVTVDYAAEANVMDFVYGTDRGPMCQGIPPYTAANPRDGGINISSELHGMGATVVRTHGSGVLDWNVLYPHPHLDADTADPKSYDFKAGDAYMQRITSNGFEPYFRLGAGGFDAGAGLPPPGTPYNMTALVDVLLHIAMHFNDGWGGGGFTGRKIRYFEIFNEPDSSCSWHPRPGCGQFWNRTAEDFYDVVDATARALKAWDPSLQVARRVLKQTLLLRAACSCSGARSRSPCSSRSLC